MKHLFAVLVLWSVLVLGAHAQATTTDTTTPAEPNVAVVQVKSVMNKVIAYLESFRVRQLAYFTELKEKHKDVVAETTIKDITTIMTPDTPATPGASAEAEVQGEKSNEQTMQYLQYGYAWAGEGFFSHTALYYVVVILLALCIVRFIFTRFFR